MLFHEVEINGKEYKLRLSARGIVKLERKLGGNPMNIFMAVQENQLPSLEDTIIILHASMQKYHSGIKLEDVYDLYDEYIENGGTYMELIPILLAVFKVSGFFKEENEDNEEDGTKNV